MIYIEVVKYDKMIEHEHNRLIKLMFISINKIFETD